MAKGKSTLGLERAIKLAISQSKEGTPKTLDIHTLNKFISENKENIDAVHVGMKEDFAATGGAYYREGKIVGSKVASLVSSVWATPSVRVDWIEPVNDAEEYEFDCWIVWKDVEDYT